VIEAEGEAAGKLLVSSGLLTRNAVGGSIVIREKDMLFFFCSAIEATRDVAGEPPEKEKLTKESRGRPSNSGSGREPNLEPFEDDLARVEDEVNSRGEMTLKPPGENPPDRAALLMSMIELGFENCLVNAGISIGEGNSDDRRLSDLF